MLLLLLDPKLEEHEGILPLQTRGVSIMAGPYLGYELPLKLKKSTTKQKTTSNLDLVL
tara:strand:- start:637 stop:810 length:174 start_codon:yes stop_codon:yes gene_type:complete